MKILYENRGFTLHRGLKKTRPLTRENDENSHEYRASARLGKAYDSYKRI